MPTRRVAVVIEGSTVGDNLSACIRQTRVHPCSPPLPVALNAPHRCGDVRWQLGLSYHCFCPVYQPSFDQTVPVATGGSIL